MVLLGTRNSSGISFVVFQNNNQVCLNIILLLELEFDFYYPYHHPRSLVYAVGI